MPVWIVIFAAIALAAQAPSFEVASIKTGVPADVPTGIRPVTAGGQFHAVLTLRDLIQVAYGSPLALLPSQIVGGPAWTASERFEITAKAAALATASPSGGRDRLLAMMQTLLRERFQLTLRRESRQLPIFNLVIDRPDGKPGPRLRPEDGKCVSMSGATPASSDPSQWCGFQRMTPAAISARGMTLDEFASGISTRPDIQRVIRNRTGLKGKFDLDLEYTPSLPAQTESGVDLFTAIREQLGLRLNSGAGPVDIMVIDHVERPTAD
jgi:uncharacterized protein (TIGR03435 family)